MKKFDTALNNLKGARDVKLKEQAAWRADVKRYQKKVDDVQVYIDELDAAIALLEGAA